MTGLPVLALLANAWTAFSLASLLAGLGGAALLVLALVGASWLPGFLRRPLIAAGLALIVGAAIYQAGTAKGAHDAFARDAARALSAEQTRTAIARGITDRVAVQAVRDLAAAQADAKKLKELLHDAESRADAGRVCLPRSLSRRLHDL